MSLAEIIDARLADTSGDFVPAVVASKLAAELREKDPAALTLWLDEHAERFLTDEISRRLSSTRATAARQAKARAFADAGDDVELVAQFAVVHVVADDFTRRRVGDMTGDDHRYVASAYGASGRYDLMCEAFHLAVARKVGKKRTADVLTEDQYSEMFASIAGKQPA